MLKKQKAIKIAMQIVDKDGPSKFTGKELNSSSNIEVDLDTYDRSPDEKGQYIFSEQWWSHTQILRNISYLEGKTDALVIENIEKPMYTTVAESVRDISVMDKLPTNTFYLVKTLHNKGL